MEITDTDESHVYSLRYEGSKTIFDVKQGVFALTNIPPRQQKWGGWCIEGDDSVSTDGDDSEGEFKKSRKL